MGMRKFTQSILVSLCSLAIAKGVLLWLKKNGVHPDQWVATLLGVAQDGVSTYPEIVTFLVGIFGILGFFLAPTLAGYGAILWEKLSKSADESTNQNRAKTEEKAGESPTKLPASLKELYKSDFSDCMRRTGGFAVKTNEQEFEVDWSLNSHLSAGTNSMAFYIPFNNETYDMCVVLLEKVDEIIAKPKDLQITVSNPGDTTHTEINDFPFSGLVYIYHDSAMTLEQLGSLESLYKARERRIQPRGSSYATTRWLQEGKA